MTDNAKQPLLQQPFEKYVAYNPQSKAPIKERKRKKKGKEKQLDIV